jgi:hypothetical protein
VVEAVREQVGAHHVSNLYLTKGGVCFAQRL